MKLAWLALPLATGCFPDTLHYRLRETALVDVRVDDDPAPSASRRYDMRMRTHDDELAPASFTLAHGPEGVRATWDTALPVRERAFSLVDRDGWVAQLPTRTPAIVRDDRVTLKVTPQLSYWSTRHHDGYETAFADQPVPGAHTITLATPRSNLALAEQRGDRTRVWIGLGVLCPGVIYSALGAGFLATEKHAGGKALGGVFASAGLVLDVLAIHELVRGTHRKTLHP